MDPRNFLRPLLKAGRRTVLGFRRRFALAVVAEIERRAATGRPHGLRTRLAWAAYALKRLGQECLTRNWPLRRGRGRPWLLEMRTAFGLKLIQWAERPVGWAPDNYAAHRRNNALTPAEADAMRAANAAWPDRPLISILTAVHDAEPAWLERLAASIRAQTYDRWEWLVVDDASERPDTWPALARLAERDRRIVVERRPRNGGVVAATNRAAELSSGAFLAFADHDDELLPDALWLVAERLRAVPDADLVYSDEEIVPAAGPPTPMPKPAFSPELLLAYNYMCHFVALRREAFEAVGGLRPGTDGAQDYDLILRALPRLRRVEHVPRVLYRWHATPQSLSRTVDRRGRTVARTPLRELTRRVVQEHLDRIGTPAEVRIVGDWALPRFLPAAAGKVSILICSKDQPAMLRRTVESIVARTDYPDWELLLVDNGSGTPEEFDRLAEFVGAGRCRVLRIANGPDGFNWSRLNNLAAQSATGEFLLFLNDDMEVREPEWLSALVGTARQPAFAGDRGVGAVGAFLQYPDGRVQHAGVICGAMGWGPWHALLGARLPDPTAYLGWARFPRNFRAVTGACVLTPRRLFLELGGFDQTALRVAFSDIDYCLRAGAAGFRIAYAPQATLIHYESQSRGKLLDCGELAAMAARCRGIEDPYWPAAFTREHDQLEVDSRRRSRRVLFRDRPPRVLFAGPAVPIFGAVPEWRLLMRELAGRGAVQPFACAWDGDPAGSLRAAEAECEPDAIFVQGVDGGPAVEAAAAPTVWHLPERVLARGGGPADVSRIMRIARALRRPVQVVHNDPFSRGSAQAGFMLENQRCVPAVPIVPAAALPARAALGAGPDDLIVAFVARPEEPEGLEQLRRTVAFLPAEWRRRTFVLLLGRGAELPRGVRGAVRDDPAFAAQADVFCHHPWSMLRDEAALRALEAGVPYLGIRHSQHADVAQNLATGQLIGDYRPRHAAEALARLFADPEKRRWMGDQARGWLASRDDGAGILGQWADLLRGAAELGGVRGPSRQCEPSAERPLATAAISELAERSG